MRPARRKLRQRAAMRHGKSAEPKIKEATSPRLKEPIVARSAQMAAPESLVLFNTKAEGVANMRSSIAYLYSLAASLHSQALPFATRSMRTESSSGVTLDQVWGQLRLLMHPVVRRLGNNVGMLKRTFTTEAIDSAETSSARKKKQVAQASTGGEGPNDDATDKSNDDMGEGDSESASSIAESELDEEIGRLLEKRKRKGHLRMAKKSGRGKNSGDDWRYAFGKGNEDDEDDIIDSEDDYGIFGDNREGSEEAAEARGSSQKSTRRVRDRNARVTAEMSASGENAEGEDEGNAEEELAALREMYGDDFDEDDLEGEGGFDGSDVDEDIDEMLEEEEEDENISGATTSALTRGKGPRAPDSSTAAYEEAEGLEFNEADAKFWGREDILDDVAGNFGEGDDTGLEAGELDDEDAAFEQELASNADLTELQRERLREQRSIAKMEEERILGTRQWAMGGEVAASRRPIDSLLDERLNFEHGMKSVPVITEQTTANLEERIKQRVLEKQFNDVERRAKLTTPDALVTTKRDAALDSQKSKLSLMDLYEKDFMDKMKRAEEAAGVDAPSAEPLTEIEKDELRALQMWKRLSQHLDALSNFFFTPKPVQMELEARVRAVENQAPAITIEAVGPFAATREAALAPQDLYRPAKHKLADVGSNEMDPRERRALRRAKRGRSKATNARKSKQQELDTKKSEEKLKRRNAEREAEAATKKSRRG